MHFQIWVQLAKTALSTTDNPQNICDGVTTTTTLQKYDAVGDSLDLTDDHGCYCKLQAGVTPSQMSSGY